MLPAGPDGAQVNQAVSMGWGQWLLVASFVAAPLVLVILWLSDVVRPGSLARHSARETGGQPVIIWTFAAIVTFAAFMTGAVGAGAIPLRHLGEASEIRDQAVHGLAGYVVGCAAGFALAWLIASTPGGARAGLTARWKDGPVGLGAMLLVAPVLVALMALAPKVVHLVTGEWPDNVAHEGLKLMLAESGSPWAWVLIACAVVVAPILEELIYRGFLQSALVRGCDAAGVNRWLGVIGASALFAGVHAGTVPPHGLAILFVLGTCFGVAFERTGRLGVPIVMHALFNAANVVIAFGR